MCGKRERGLDSALSSIEMLMFETPPTDHDDMHLQLFLYTYAQTITTIRYLKNKSGKNRYAAFRYSLLLYKLLKEMLFDLIDSSGRIMPSLFYQEIKESIFRATFFCLCSCFSCLITWRRLLVTYRTKRCCSPE